MRRLAVRLLANLLVSPWVAAVMLVPVSAATVATISPLLQQQILAAPGTAVAGPADAKIRIVEYFDYNCPFCRKLAPDLRKLHAGSADVSLTFKDWPIFGGVSVYAAKSAIAAQWQGKYLEAHEALMSAPRLTAEAQIDAVLTQAGIDMPRLRQDAQQHYRDIDALLARNAAEAKSIGLRGTPGLVVGRHVEANIDGVDDLKAAVLHAR